ncbi:reverse transcriptase [Gossypium australe]|uniref:Reverse transcriptase n=1 Tax=Gossypium australe TaxID=47621 RepID=A0A5B6WXG7_9ROSI|nr:reverse transcriptase [Gossypium australe]
MGFASSWVESIIHYLKTATYSIVVNGKKGQKFLATRGLRQGDPLSPYLFLICSEGLSTLMEGFIEGAKVVTPLTHIRRRNKVTEHYRSLQIKYKHFISFLIHIKNQLKSIILSLM